MNEELLEKLHKRRAYFQKHFPRLKGADNRSDVKNLPNTCPSCGYLTLYDRCVWDICGICFWQDDGQDNAEADKFYGGPNDAISITAERLKWLSFLEKKPLPFACEELDELNTLIEQNSEDTKQVLVLLDAVCAKFDAWRNIPYYPLAYEFEN